MKFKSVGMLVLAHLATDLNQGAIPVLLPFFIAAHHVNYTTAALMVFITNAVSTFMQPVFGYIADRKPMPWVIPAAMCLAAFGVSFSGFAPTFNVALIGVAISGIGFAAFHPEGARFVSRLAGEKRATGMSYFSVGGQLGFAVGPLAATAALLPSGLNGTIWLGVPALILSAVMPRLLSEPANVGAERGVFYHAGDSGPDEWTPFCFLAAAMLCRSVVVYGLTTFLPVYLIHVLHASKATAGSIVTVLMAGSIIGNLLGGRMADRFGLRIIVVAGFGLASCLLPFTLMLPSIWWLAALFALAGMTLSLPISPMVVLGQTYLPNHVGLASGVTLGLALSFGGIMTPFLGMIADRYGLRAAILVLVYLPFVCALLSLKLKKPEQGWKQVPKNRL